MYMYLISLIKLFWLKDDEQGSTTAFESPSDGVSFAARLSAVGEWWERRVFSLHYLFGDGENIRRFTIITTILGICCCIFHEDTFPLALPQELSKQSLETSTIRRSGCGSAPSFGRKTVMFGWAWTAVYVLKQRWVLMLLIRTSLKFLSDT